MSSATFRSASAGPRSAPTSSAPPSRASRRCAFPRHPIGRALRLKGKGIADLRGYGRGDTSCGSSSRRRASSPSGSRSCSRSSRRARGRRCIRCPAAFLDKVKNVRLTRRLSKRGPSAALFGRSLCGVAPLRLRLRLPHALQLPPFDNRRGCGVVLTRAKERLRDRGEIALLEEIRRLLPAGAGCSSGRGRCGRCCGGFGIR